MKNESKNGFTIIEVVLVLAIAGLIFLMVFIALPALQRGQRNTQRKNDLNRFVTAVSSYQSNNSGKTPFGNIGDKSSLDDTQKVELIKNFVKRYIDDSCTFTGSDHVMGGAYNNANNPAVMHFYFTGCSSQFSDPDGESYGIDVRAPETQAESMLNQAVGLHQPNGANNLSHLITVYSRAKCNEKEGYIDSSSRFGLNQFAVFYLLEGGSIACVDNQ